MEYAAVQAAAAASSAPACRRRISARRNICRRFVESEIKTWSAAVKAAGITAE